MPTDGSLPAAEAARAAARNNAEWCDTVCRSHGLPGRVDPDAWVNPNRTPRYYPDAVTLDPAATAEAILGRIDTSSPGCSIKDSFAALDLEAAGFEVVHEAEWIYRPAQPARISRRQSLAWSVIATADDLAAWEAAWQTDDARDRVFHPALLRDPTVTILAGRLDGAIVAGAIANRTGTDLVGLSNVYTTTGDPDIPWAGSLAYLDAIWPGLGIVGYESGTDLSIAIRHGFRVVGPLRIWRAVSGAS